MLLPLILIVGIVTGLAFAAVILRLACFTCHVRHLPISAAIKMVLVSSLVTGAAGGGLALLLSRLVSGFDGIGDAVALRVAAGISLLLVNLLASAWVYRMLMRTSFRRAVRIWFTQVAMLVGFSLIVASVSFVAEVLMATGPEEDKMAVVPW